MKWMKSLIAVALLTIVMTPALSPQSAAASLADVSPSGEVSIQGFFDPSFQYLDQGDSSIVDNGTQKVKINVSTVAKQSVHMIGVYVYLDWGDGSNWVQLNANPAQLTDYNTNYISGSVTFSIVSGYYYRARTFHWVNHSGVYEEGGRTTAIILAK